MSRYRLAPAIVLALLIPFLGGSLSATPMQNAPSTHAATLSLPRVDVLEDGKIVINVETAGDFRGLLTLNLTEDNGVLKGDWMLSVRYTDNTDPATGLEPPNHEHESADQHEAASGAGDDDHPHLDFVRLVDMGVIGGQVESASVALGPDGALDFTAVLKITLGTLNFNGVSGTGNADLANGLTLVF